jgi:hypothetical protein
MCCNMQRHGMPCYVNGSGEVSTPQLLYTNFYNHAHRLRLEKLLFIELSRSSNGFL